jgi:hypothetical protein
VINITSGDAGAVSRFADLYQHMRGGLLNLAIRLGAGDDWDGSIDVRRFSIVNEQRLHSIVSTPVGQEQRSLNSAVKRTSIHPRNASSAALPASSRRTAWSASRTAWCAATRSARLPGHLRDQRGNMDMTGTFMPAYGLNRLFANCRSSASSSATARDRGLIGITFKLTGKLDAPNLTINPLSIIAPGVFRNIFEFQ